MKQFPYQLYPQQFLSPISSFYFMLHINRDKYVYMVCSEQYEWAPLLLLSQVIGETEFNKTEVFILGGQRIYQNRKKGWWRGRRERIEKGSRERKETIELS